MGKAHVIAAGTILGAAVGFSQGDLSQGLVGAATGYNLQKSARTLTYNGGKKAMNFFNEKVFGDAYTDYQTANGFDYQEMEQRTKALMEMDRSQIINSEKLDAQTKAYGMAVHDMKDSYQSMGMKEKDAQDAVKDTLVKVQNSNDKRERKKQAAEKRKLKRQKKQK